MSGRFHGIYGKYHCEAGTYNTFPHQLLQACDESVNNSSDCGARSIQCDERIATGVSLPAASLVWPMENAVPSQQNASTSANADFFIDQPSPYSNHIISSTYAGYSAPAFTSDADTYGVPLTEANAQRNTNLRQGYGLYNISTRPMPLTMASTYDLPPTIYHEQPQRVTCNPFDFESNAVRDDEYAPRDHRQR